MTAVRAAGVHNQVGAVRGPALTWKMDVVKFFRKSAAA
jgi:hypothetical protein